MSLKFKLNLVASGLTFVMGLSHFVVPYLFPWEDHIAGLYAPIGWALLAMNFFFSFLLTWAGILTYISYYHRALRKWIVGGMAAFWVIGGLYELIIPFPVREAQWILPIVSFSISVLYFVVLYLDKRDSKRAEGNVEGRL